MRHLEHSMHSVAFIQIVVYSLKQKADKYFGSYYYYYYYYKKLSSYSRMDIMRDNQRPAGGVRGEGLGRCVKNLNCGPVAPLHP